MKLATILLLITFSCVLFSLTESRRRTHDDAAESKKCVEKCSKIPGHTGVYWSDSIQQTSGCKCCKVADVGRIQCENNCRIRASNTKTALVAQFSGSAASSKCKCVKQAKRLFLEKLSRFLRGKPKVAKKTTGLESAASCKVHCGTKVSKFTDAVPKKEKTNGHAATCTCSKKRRMFIQRGDKKTTKHVAHKEPQSQADCIKDCKFVQGAKAHGKKKRTQNACKCTAAKKAGKGKKH